MPSLSVSKRPNSSVAARIKGCSLSDWQSLCLKAYFTQGHFQEELKQHIARANDLITIHLFLFLFFDLVTVDVRTGGLTKVIAHTALLQL